MRLRPPRHWHLWTLALITLLGGVLRFWNLTHPPLWGDEGSTFHRVTTDYRDLLDRLQVDGFPPLHYELYWWIGKGMPLWDAQHPLFQRLGPREYGFTPLGRWVVLGGGGLILLLCLFGVAARWPSDWTLLLTGIATASFCTLVAFYWWRYGLPAWSQHAFTAHLARLTPMLAVAGAVALLWWLARSLAGSRAAWMIVGGVCGLVVLICGLTALRSGAPAWGVEAAAVGELPLGPWTMRLIPALTGTAMVPAFYLLAIHILRRPAALAATLVVACSAYMLVYSRDAKMYMPAWFFMTLHAGLLLQWLRMGGRIAWLGWVFAGLAAVGLHASVGAIILIEIIFVLTMRRALWKHIVLASIGLAIVGSGWAGYKVGFNKWTERTGGFVPSKADVDDPEGSWGESGISWVAPYQAGRNGTDLVLHTATAFLFSWEWPKDLSGTGDQWGMVEFNRVMNRPMIPPWVVSIACAALAILLALMIVGALPWKRRSTDIPVCAPPDPVCAPSDPACAPQPWWRTALWLAIWLVVPTYGVFYCRSMPWFVSPGEWGGMIWGLWSGNWPYALLAAILIGAALWWWRPGYSALVGLLVAALLAITLTFVLTEPMPRSATARLGITVDGTRIAGIELKSPAELAGLMVGDRILEVNGQPVSCREDLAVATSHAGPDASIPVKVQRGQETRTVQAVLRGPFVKATILEGYYQTIRAQVFRWLAAGLIVVVVPMLWYFGGRSTTERFVRLGQFVLVAAVVIGLCYAAYAFWDGERQAFKAAVLREDPNANWELEYVRKWQPVWMPRYIGMVWPAAILASVALLMRVPLRPLRVVGVGVLLAVNLANGIHRITGDSEPPLDVLAADLWESASPVGTTRTFNNFVAGGAHPADASIIGSQGRYYMCHEADLRPIWYEFRSEVLWDRLRAIRPGLQLRNNPTPAAIRSQADGTNVNRVIVWQRYGCPEFGYTSPPPPLPVPAEDDVLRSLGPQWTRTEATDYDIRQHWQWRDRGMCRRRVYVKSELPPPAPTTAPATSPAP